MRKLRDDITLAEAYKWAIERCCVKNNAYLLVEQLYEKKHLSYYPESFFEQPPIDSFGEFSNYKEKSCGEYGYLHRICVGLEYNFMDSHDTCWRYFTPGFPDDVDADGYPKK